MYSTNFGFQPNTNSAATLNYSRDCLPLTYLGVPISGRRARQQDWLKFILLVGSRLISWKANYLFLWGRLTLLNSVLSSIPTYWMSVFKLPLLVSNEIDRVSRDFLGKRPELGPKGICLVAWSRICKPRKMGGWCILNIQISTKHF